METIKSMPGKNAYYNIAITQRTVAVLSGRSQLDRNVYYLSFLSRINVSSNSIFVMDITSSIPALSSPS